MDSSSGWKPFILIALLVAVCVFVLPEVPLSDSQVKSSAIVPLLSSRILENPNSRALARLDQVCDKYCTQKTEQECLRGQMNVEARHRAIRDELLSLSSEVG